MSEITQYWVKVVAAAVAGIVLLLGYTNPPMLIVPDAVSTVLLGALVLTFGWQAWQGGKGLQTAHDLATYIEVKTDVESPKKKS